MNDAERESLVTIFEPKNQEIIRPDLEQAEKGRESPEITCLEEVRVDEEGGEEVQIGCQKCPQLFLTEADLILHTDFQHGEINDTLNNLQDFNVLLEEEEAEEQNPEKVKVAKSKKSIEEICKELETSQRPLIKFKWPKIKVKTKCDSDDDEIDILLQTKEPTKEPQTKEPTKADVPIKAKARASTKKRKPPTMVGEEREVLDAGMRTTGNHLKENQTTKKADGEEIEKEDQGERSERDVGASSKKSSLTKKDAPMCFKRKDWNQEGKWKSGFLHLCDSIFHQSWPEAKVWLEQNEDHLLRGQKTQIFRKENAGKTSQTPKKENKKAEKKTPVKSESKTAKRSEEKTPIKSVAKNTQSGTSRKSESKPPAKSTSKTPLKTTPKTPTKSTSKTPTKSTSKTPTKSTSKTPLKTTLKTPTKSSSKTPTKTDLKATQAPKKSNLKTPMKSEPKTPTKVSKKILIKYEKPKAVIKDHSIRPLSDDTIEDGDDENNEKKRVLEGNSESQPKRRKLPELGVGGSNGVNGSLQVKWDCTLCGVNFAVKRNLAIHMQKKHGVYDHFEETNTSKVLKTPKKRKSWDCEPCDFQFELKRDLATHNESQHRPKRAPGLRQCK